MKKLLVPFLVLVALTISWLEGVHGGTQSPGCPCLDFPNVSSFFTQIGTANASAGGLCYLTTNNLCVPESYGTGFCDSHDSSLNFTAPECNPALESNPEYCGHSFCYVDPNNCDRPHDPSDYFPGLFYSYETCGFVNAYSVDRAFFGEEITESLRLAYPSGTLDTGYIIRNLPNGDVDGAFPIFLNRIFDEANISITVVDVSADAGNYYSSSYSACVYDIALGNVDICGGDFWRTVERSLLSGFGPEVDQDFFYIVSSYQEPSVIESLLFPFAPFSIEVWALIIGGTIAFSTAIGILETEKCAPIELTHYMYLGFLSFVSASPVFEPRYAARGISGPSGLSKSSSRVLNVLFGVVLTVVLAIYVATLTALLVAEDRVGSVETLDDIIANKLTTCITTAAIPAVSAQKPAIAPLLIQSSTSKLLKNMDDGVCEVAIIYEAAFTPSGHCNKTLSKGSVFNMGITVPISREHTEYLSYLLTRGLRLGYWDEAVTEAKARFLDTPPCAGDGEGLQLDVSSFQRISGIFILLFSIVAIIFLFHFIQYMFRKQTSDEQLESSKVEHEKKDDV